MTNEKTDWLIREKAEMPYNFTEFTHSDKQRLWKCMEHKLKKDHTRKNHWWSYAAVLLIFITGMYIFYTQQHSATEFLRNNPAKRSSGMEDRIRQSPANHSSESNPIAGNRATKRKSKRKRVSKGKKEKAFIAAAEKKISQDSTDILPGKSISYVKAINSDSINVPSKATGHSIASTKSAAVPSLPVVYYNEITAPQDDDHSPVETLPELSIRLGNKKVIQKNLVFNKSSLDKELRINIAPKN